MGIIQDTISAKATKDLEPLASDELTEAKIDEVLGYLRKSPIRGEYLDSNVCLYTSIVTGVSQDDVREIYTEMQGKLN